MNYGPLFEDALFAAMAAVGFSSISHTPRRIYIVCAVAAAAGHALRTLLLQSPFPGLNIIAASTLAALVIGVIAVLSARRVHVPAEACLFPALLPMIPGMYAYRTVAGLVGILTAADESESIHSLHVLSFNGFTCTAIIIGMAIGALTPMFILKKLSFQATR